MAVAEEKKENEINQIKLKFDYDLIKYLI